MTGPREEIRDKLTRATTLVWEAVQRFNNCRSSNPEKESG